MTYHVFASRTIRVLAFLVILAMEGTAMAGDGPVRIEEVEYRGWKRNIKLSNGEVELIATLDVGPRIISYKLVGGQNVFKEFDDQMGRSGESEWIGRGGHRLWTAPEDTTRTYALDNSPIAYERIADGDLRHLGSRHPVRDPEADRPDVGPSGESGQAGPSDQEHRLAGDGAGALGTDGHGAGRDGNHPDAPEEAASRQSQECPVSGRFRP